VTAVSPSLPVRQTPLERITDPVFEAAGVEVRVKRDDLIHPTIPGNKYRKLKYNLIEASRAGHDTLLTFGGAFSNHLYATASAGQLLGFRTIGVVRGEEHRPLNPVLATASAAGMELHYLDRASYREKDSEAVFARFKETVGRFYLVPEGGSNALGVRGCAEIVEEIEEPFDYICTAVGTGGTLAGLISGLRGRQQAIGVSVLKGATFLEEDVRRLLEESGYTRGGGRWRIELGYHFGGFAKVKPELVRFIREFEARHRLSLDPIYTGKMMYALFDLAQSGLLPPGARIVALHTGGVPERHYAELFERR